MSSYLWLFKHDPKASLLNFDDSSFSTIALPFSQLFENDLRTLVKQGMVNVSTEMMVEEGFIEWAKTELKISTKPADVLSRLLIEHIAITDKGKAWISKNMGTKEDFDLLVDDIAGTLEYYVKKSDHKLYQKVQRIVYSKERQK